MDTISLLFPADIGEVPVHTLPDETINDLSVPYICAQLSNNAGEQNVIKNIMVQLCDDPRVIRYRCDIFEDVLRFPELRRRIGELLDQLDFLKSVERLAKDTDASSIWQLVNRLNELDSYIDCIAGIRDCLKGLDIHSQGFRDLRDFVENVYEDSGFDYLKQDIRHLQQNVCKIKSLTLGVNLDSQLRPIETGIVSINNEAYKEMGVLRNLLDFTKSKEEIHEGVKFTGMAPFHVPKVTRDVREEMLGALEIMASPIGVAKKLVGAATAPVQTLGDNPLMSNLNLTITDMLQGVVRNLKTVLGKYVNISGYALSALISEFTFYIKWAELVDKLLAAGATLTKPEILDEAGAFRGQGIYNMKLAVHKLENPGEEIVVNDLDFCTQHRIYVLTGPNRGGKTTITQAVGILYLLAQNGIYVPGAHVALCPVDNIFTHFPADENQTVDLGRLGEESKRFSEIFSQATARSLLLLNESFATTSFTEGLYIAKDITKSLKYLGANTIFNTHMHELAASLDEMNATLDAPDQAVSLITGVEEGKRSYKVSIAPPQGLSFAQDIAQKYGVTFAQLQKLIADKKAAAVG